MYYILNATAIYIKVIFLNTWDLPPVTVNISEDMMFANIISLKELSEKKAGCKVLLQGYVRKVM